MLSSIFTWRYVNGAACLGLAVDIGGGSLVGGEDKHLGNVDVIGTTGNKDNRLGDIVTVQGDQTLVDRVSLFLVTTESNHRELCLHQTYLFVSQITLLNKS